MKLLGLGINPVPYTPVSERESENPTVFWIKPKTVGLIQKEIGMLDMKGIPHLTSYVSNEEMVDFLSTCCKVNNFHFYEDEKVTPEVSGIPELTKLVSQIAPEIFAEVMDYSTIISILSGAQRKCIELMTYFALTKNEKMAISDRLSYDCENCQLAKKHEERICFFLNEFNTISMPVLGEQDEFTLEYNVFPNTKNLVYSAEEFLEEFFDIVRRLYPTVPAYLALLRLHQYLSWDKEVCVTGLISRDFIQLLDWAIDCKNMGASPYPGEYFNQPNQLIEGFKAVNTTISEFERVLLKSSTKKGNSSKEG
jgi:hypothetical protein